MTEMVKRVIAAYRAIKGLMGPPVLILVALSAAGCDNEPQDAIPVFVYSGDDTDTDTGSTADSDSDGYGDSTDTGPVVDTSPVVDTDVVDADADGFPEDEDCDDNDAAVNPGANESCNGIDDNCDGSTDEGITATWYLDNDQDGYGNVARSVSQCTAPSADYVADATDCDDNDAAVNPGAIEVCDDGDVDENCDGEADGEDADGATNWFSDDDVDGFGDEADVLAACDQPSGYADNADDCDNADPTAFPGGTEVCDDADNDCDGVIDEDDAADAATWYVDADSDGYGDSAVTDVACDAPTGYVANATDCDDAVVTTYPNAAESCNGADDDCDGVVDEDDASDAATWHLDRDSDGFGDSAATDVDCDAPVGYVADSTDCDDTEASVFPGGSEVCDDLDNDCDGSVDNDASDAAEWYADADSDSYGDPDSTQVSCDVPSGYVADSTDCDDSSGSAYPGADESDCADPVDYNCDGSSQFVDADADGYAACEDCDDASASVHPYASEYCNGVNDDCDALTDEDDAIDATVWYEDADEDGFGDEVVSEQACSAPAGTVADATDCDDGDDSVNPDAQEVCDDLDVDEDCSGSADDDDASATGQSTWYLDDDGDGFGGSTTDSQCESPGEDYVEEGDDCDDESRFDYPDATEYEDGRDNDCDGEIDEDFVETDTGDTVDTGNMGDTGDTGAP